MFFLVQMNFRWCSTDVVLAGSGTCMQPQGRAFAPNTWFWVIYLRLIYLRLRLSWCHDHLTCQTIRPSLELTFQGIQTLEFQYHLGSIYRWPLDGFRLSYETQLPKFLEMPSWVFILCVSRRGYLQSYHLMIEYLVPCTMASPIGGRRGFGERH